MRCEIVAVGTELLLGQIVDTNSAWIGERLALTGVDCYFVVKVGDNRARVGEAIRQALARSEGVIVCGGLGPTQDDVTREALADVMGVPLVRDEAVAETIRQIFERRGREMAASNLRQADVPVGATVIPQRRGTAPGLLCPIGDRVVYAVPGVPHELKEMVERAVLPDLRARLAAAGQTATIVSRTLRTWGVAESALAELIADRVDAQTNPTIAFLASGIEGIKVRLTAKAPTAEGACQLLDAEEAALRSRLGTLVFGVDEETMEHAVTTQLLRRSLCLAVAESLTGGLVASRLVSVPGASDWFAGGVVAYATEAKHKVLGVTPGPVVSERCAAEMAQGVAQLLDADVGLGTTGVAGPTEQEGQPVGAVFLGLYVDGCAEASRVQLPGDRDQIRQFAAISALNLLRLRLLER